MTLQRTIAVPMLWTHALPVMDDLELSESFEHFPRPEVGPQLPVGAGKRASVDARPRRIGGAHGASRVIRRVARYEQQPSRHEPA